MKHHDDDEVMVTTIRADKPSNVEGAKLGVCSECGASVWLAPSTIELIISTPKMFIMCAQCSIALMKEYPEYEYSLRV